ncbi:MAG: hypothetical protein KME30_06490 [Iphinoe sp. HA4291-MV1]|nr:hypothetical protein [Iphinoe sp. HA4291-MV1]
MDTWVRKFNNLDLKINSCYEIKFPFLISTKRDRPWRVLRAIALAQPVRRTYASACPEDSAGALRDRPWRALRAIA